jgi:phosphonate transport system ATP-binding protein
MRRRIGMIFQQFNLVKRHSVLDNVLSGALGRGHMVRSLFLSFTPDEVAFARSCLQRVGLLDRASERADRLSGGQQQRVAISRALMQRPEIILADEPVASLDPALRHSVMRHIEALNREEGMTVICSLHDIDLVRRYASRIVALKAGRLVWEGQPEHLDASTFREIYGEDAEPASNSSVEEEP